MSKYVILDNIRSIHNVGSIFRTSDAFGVDKIFLCGCTPTPIDRFGRKRKDLAKTALGAEDNIAWEYRKTTEEAILELKKLKYSIVAVEQDSKSIKIGDFDLKNEKTALLMGNEVDGVSKDILKMVDTIVEIPMFGKKESLNVSVAFGIASFCIFLKSI